MGLDVDRIFLREKKPKVSQLIEEESEQLDNKKVFLLLSADSTTAPNTRFKNVTLIRVRPLFFGSGFSQYVISSPQYTL